LSVTDLDKVTDEADTIHNFGVQSESDTAPCYIVPHGIVVG
jgi:hypothetical protein